MSSTERAPEPTMEEMLASIRRVISDNKSSSARQETASRSRSDDEDLKSGEGEADDEIINDVARVLSGTVLAPNTNLCFPPRPRSQRRISSTSRPSLAVLSSSRTLGTLRKSSWSRWRQRRQPIFSTPRRRPMLNMRLSRSSSLLRRSRQRSLWLRQASLSLSRLRSLWRLRLSLPLPHRGPCLRAKKPPPRLSAPSPPLGQGRCRRRRAHFLRTSPGPSRSSRRRLSPSFRRSPSLPARRLHRASALRRPSTLCPFRSPFLLGASLRARSRARARTRSYRG